MEAMDLLLNRTSIAPKMQGDVAPDDDCLRRILTAACRAPDHGLLRPWRFIVIRGEARARLGAVFAEALQSREPEAKQAEIEKELNRPLRSPVIVAVIAKVDENHPKIPAIEQILSAGAAAHAILLAAQAEGFGAMMLTGVNAYDSNVKAALGVAPSERIVAYVYIGDVREQPPEPARPVPEDCTSEWTAPEDGGQ